MKTTRHSLLAKGLMVLLSLLVMVFAFTYSWYKNTDDPTTADGIAAKVVSSGDFEYAIGFYNNGTGGNYKITDFTKKTTALNLESLEASDGNTYNLLHDYKPIDVTGDGRTLIRPAMSYGNQQIDKASNDYSIAEPNVQYISFDLYFRSTVPNLAINLGNGSWVKAGCEINGSSSLIGSSTTDSFNKSTYGNFSKDAIAGAVRIAFVPYDYSSTLGNIPANLNAYEQNTPEYLGESASFIWVPRPDIYLAPNQSGTSGWTLTQVANQSTTAVAGTTNVHTFYNIFKCQPAKADGIPASDTAHFHMPETYGNTVLPIDLANNGSRQFTAVSPDVHFDNYYYSKVNVRIWVEGTDTESRRATSGGKFEVNFKFTTT